MSTTLYHYKNHLRNYVLNQLFNIIGWLSNTNMTDVEEESAELVNDRRGLKIDLIFGGLQHTIVLPYNPYKLSHNKFIVKDKITGEILSEGASTLPGLDDFIYTAPIQGKIYNRDVEVITETNDDDD